MKSAEYMAKFTAGLKCRLQVTDQVTGYRPQVRLQATGYRSPGHGSGHRSHKKNNRTLDKAVLD